MGEVLKLRPGERFQVRIPFKKIDPGYSYRAVFVELSSVVAEEDDPEPRLYIQTDLEPDAKLSTDGELVLPGVVPNIQPPLYLPMAYLEVIRAADGRTHAIDAREIQDCPSLDIIEALPTP